MCSFTFHYSFTVHFTIVLQFISLNNFTTVYSFTCKPEFFQHTACNKTTRKRTGLWFVTIYRINRKCHSKGPKKAITRHCKDKQLTPPLVHSQTPCSAGTYSAAVGASTPDTCQPCKEGYACPELHTTVPTVSFIYWLLFW